MGRGSLEEDTNHVLVLSEQRHLFLYFCISFYTSVLLFLSHRYILCRISQVAQLVAYACSVGETGSIPGCEDPLKKEMATHSSILAWEIPWTNEFGRLQSRVSEKSGTWLSNWKTIATEQQEPMLGPLPNGYFRGHTASVMLKWYKCQQLKLYSHWLFGSDSLVQKMSSNRIMWAMQWELLKYILLSPVWLRKDAGSCIGKSQTSPKFVHSLFPLLYIIICCCFCLVAMSGSFVTPWTVACQAPLSVGFPR